MVMKQYAEQIKQSVQELFGKTVHVELTRPAAGFGDYSTNVAMQLANDLAKQPRDIAAQIKVKLDQSDLFADVKVAGPGFINLTVPATSLAAELRQGFNATDPFGTNQDGAGRRALVEYPSTNMAKPFSVGHLRSANQGWAARNLLLATGWEVITDNHLGDYGSPFGVWVVGFKLFSSETKLQRDGIYELGNIYIQTKKAIAAEQAQSKTDIEDQAQAWLLKLEAGDPEAVLFSNRFNQISLDHVHRVMARLGISTDYELGEKFFAKRGKQIVHDLISRGLAQQNQDGSVVITLDEYGIKTPMLVLKSNGAALYATTDLATLFYRDRQLHVQRVVYCVASEQKFYFEQLFAVAKKIGLSTELIHMWYGLIDQINDDGTREKMSSRKGVVLLEELLDEAERLAKANAKAKDVTNQDIKKIAVGAIKFNDFSADRRTGMLFDWKTMFNLAGFSGPYVQYAAVRVNKILRDNQDFSGSMSSDYDYQAEKAVILKLLDYPAIVKLAADKLDPHRIASYVYELAKQMNRYYENTPVATAEVPRGIKTARLALLEQVAYVFTSGLAILGIAIPSKM